jgi:hypothetical protein
MLSKEQLIAANKCSVKNMYGCKHCNIRDEGNCIIELVETALELYKENEELKGMLLKGAKIVIKQDPSLDLTAALDTIRYLQGEIQRIHNLNREISIQAREYRIESEKMIYEYEKKHGLKQE